MLWHLECSTESQSKLDFDRLQQEFEWTMAGTLPRHTLRNDRALWYDSFEICRRDKGTR